MIRTPFAVRRQIQLAIMWYGTEYEFKRDVKDQYGEPTGEKDTVSTIDSIFHASKREFVELINAESVTLKNKLNKGLICSHNEELSIQQGDYVEIDGTEYCVTAIEQILYGSTVIAQEISLEEFIEGVEEV